jgi:hypothetical protein
VTPKLVTSASSRTREAPPILFSERSYGDD